MNHGKDFFTLKPRSSLFPLDPGLYGNSATPRETMPKKRRTLLKLGRVSAAVLTIAGAAVALLQPRLNKGKLSAAGHSVFLAVGHATLDRLLLTETDARQCALNSLLKRIDAVTQSLPPHTQAELSQLLSLLANSWGRRALVGLNRPWAEASEHEIQQALQLMYWSGLALMQQACTALREITTGAFFPMKRAGRSWVIPAA